MGFALSWPLYSVAIKADGGDLLQTYYTETGLKFVPIFTDIDLAERYIRNEPLGGEPRAIESPARLAAFLRALRADGHTHVGFDIGGTYPVTTIDEVLSRAELQEDSDSDQT